MNNTAMAEVLARLARLVDLKEKNVYKTRAYERAARLIESWPEPVALLVQEGRLEALPGIGASISSIITEIERTGSSHLLESLESEYSPYILAFMTLPRMSEKKARTLHEGLNISTLDELANAAGQGRVRELPGFNETSETRLLDAIQQARDRTGKWIISHALEMAEVMRERVPGA
ncbi:MAG TPA: helix-hairpin-helix domain-containing protein, partial [Candidatus Xenobia bacterium]